MKNVYLIALFAFVGLSEARSDEAPPFAQRFHESFFQSAFPMTHELFGTMLKKSPREFGPGIELRVQVPKMAEPVEIDFEWQQEKRGSAPIYFDAPPTSGAARVLG